MISQRLQSDLNDLAMNDALTRVRNRRAMQNMLDFEMQRVQNEVKDFSIILLDVDHFKRVNDTHGHDVGDLVLQWMAQTLQASLRAQDIVARWGGEEFLILLPDTGLDEAMTIAERMCAAVEKSTVAGVPVPLHSTFSGGVACSKSNRNVDQLCKVADQALYVAKQTRNRIVSQEQIPETSG
jgi:diguanylate cyclase (GGDEF)-like protein